MGTPTHSRSTRDRPAKAPLSRVAVVDAALDVCHREGLDAVTMRRVATELDTGAASLYVYVRNRDELVGAMGDRAVSVLDLEAPDPDRWREQLHELLGRILRAFAEYPGLAASTLATLPATDAPFVLIENLLGLLLAGGIGRQDAAWGCDILSLITTATAIENDVRRDRGPSMTGLAMADFVEDLRGRFLALPADRFPLVVATADEMVTGDGDDRFRFAVDALLDGMVARAARAARAGG
jgi:AcrR family transcriptional regulator